MVKQKDPARDRVIEELQNLGLDAQAIPETKEKRPDVYVKDGNELLLLEVKTKFDANGYIELIEAEINKNGHAVLSETLEWRRAHSSVIHTAVKQLSAHDDSSRAMKITWIECAGIDSNDQYKFWLYSLYGIACIADFGDTPRQSSGNGILDVISVQYDAFECDYFCESEFYKYRLKLDGVIIAKDNERIMLVNDKSQNAERLHKSRFTSLVATTVIDPLKCPIPGKRYYADCDNARTDVKATIDHIAKKYTLRRPMQMEMKRHIVMMRPPEK